MNNILSQVGYRVFYVWMRNAVSYRRFVFPTLIASIGEPLLYLVAIGFGLGSYLGLINGMPYLNFMAPGLIVSAIMFSATFECTYSSFVRMTIEKVYNAQLVTPVSVEEVIAGEILWGMTRGAISGIIMLAMLAAFGLAKGAWLAAYPLLWIFTGFFFASLSMVITSFARNFDFFTYYFQLFISPMFFFSGIFFPLDHFPPAVQMVAHFLPLTYAVNISRALIEGTVSARILLDLSALIIPGIIFFALALYRMKKRIVK